MGSGVSGGTLHDTARLRPGQLAMVTAIGIVFWFIGVMAVRFGIEAGVFGSVWLFVASVPVGPLTVWIVKRLAGLRREQIVGGITVGCAAAALFDGVAMTWMRTMYGTSAEMVLPGAAWILFVYGVTLGAAYWEANQ